MDDEYLEPRFKNSFMDVKYTAQMEEDLDLIADGKKTYLEIVETVYNTLSKEINNAKEQKMEKKEQKMVGQKCTVCNEGNIVEVNGRFGIFYSCDKYPNCKSVFQKNDDGTYSLKEKIGCSPGPTSKIYESLFNCENFLRIKSRIWV